ncbi:threonylcarbamoyl-AMP synthase [Erysipelothrix sp. HDW6C]|uniref:L-threonylcarbamoyladenylate synthase n=1 Tax=Erysipelothrix sp. HDW6C TaxID=2714930 RepID=UPI001408E3B3|nr:L-threonylcarbamoyladenylate synthase [Erysipelothrix sp. HDW6C]QIK68961.1 threonylcarbamoyl-AMP synthase [Erysipelothrix sp. HDW6C]
METKQFDKKEIDAIASTIKEGGLVAIMTDTVYGLAAHSGNDAMYQKLKDAKERPENKPFPLMVASEAQIEAVAELTDVQRHLMRTFMPGAVTFIFKRKEGVFDFLGDQKTLGIRMADDAWVHEIITKVGHPIWLPSANRSGLTTATSSDMVLEQLEGRISGVVIGNIDGGKSSSVFDLTGPEIVCLREGIITLEQIQKEAVQ